MIRKIVCCVALTCSITQPVIAEDAAEGVEQGSIASELLMQLQTLQQEILELRGLTEEQAYQLKQVKDTQRDHYLDLDRRLGGVQQKLRQVSGTAPAVGQPATIPATVAPAKNAPPLEAVTAAKQDFSNDKAPLESNAYDHAYGLVKGKKFEQAGEAFEKLLIDYPEGKFAPNAHYWMGELFMVDSDLSKAAVAFSKVVTLYPRHWKSADALYKLGEIHFRLGEPEKSRQYLNRTITQFPDSTAARFATRYLKANFPQ